MMDARLVWDTWRKVLASDDLADWTSREAKSEAPGDPDGAELVILEDYAGTPKATETNIGMYRRGLTRNAKGALGLMPVTNRLLYASGVDVDLVAEAFAKHSGYRDHGPNMWGLAEDFIDYLSRMPELASPMHRDALEIDKATAALARRLGSSTVAIWPEELARNSPAQLHRLNQQTMLYSAHPAAAVVTSAHDLTPWLENPDQFDIDDKLERSPRHWLVYFPAADADVEYAELSERSALIFRALRTPGRISDVARTMPPTSSVEFHDATAALIEIGVVASEDDLVTNRWPG